MRNLPLRLFSGLVTTGGALALLLTVSGLPSQAQTATINTLASTNFGSYTAIYGVTEGTDGNFYGQAFDNTYIFRVTPAGSLSTLSGQLAANCGLQTVGNLILAGDGNFYGTTRIQGTGGGGVLFQYNISSKTCAPIYSFNPTTDGYYPSGGLTYGSDGNFYGILSQSPEDASGSGAIFQVTPAGKFSIVYNFQNGADGGNPVGYLIEATDGNFYGATTTGGSGANTGTIYRLTPGATFPWVLATQYNLGSLTGTNPSGQIVEGPDGNLYGALQSGAANNFGSVWQLDLQDDYSDFYDFTSANRAETLVVGGDGSLYGATTYGDGANNSQGEFFKLTTAGVYTTLADFSTSSANLEEPIGQIIQGSDGDFYGTAQTGGAHNAGGVWQGVVSPAVKAPISVTLSASAVGAGKPVTVTWKVFNATSNTYRNCFAYTQTGGGDFTGKLSGTQSGATLSGTASVTPTQDGTFTYSVVCGGTEVGISPTLTVTGVQAAPTKTVLTLSPNPVPVGTNAKLTATVTKTSGSGTPTGTVTFNVLGLSQALATVSLNGSGVGTYTASTTGLPTGNFYVYATYNGDAGDATSTSAEVVAQVRYASTATLTASPNPVVEGANITLTATVTSKTGTPTGSVAFTDPAGTIATVKLNGSGVATLTASTAGIPPGTYPVTAKYLGDSTHAAVNSTALNVTVSAK